jgi:DNA-3-methyladenine glycosylase I
MANDIHCGWAPAKDALYREYHDTNWGVPEYDSRALWEKLQLDGMQAGLSWITILRKRETMREEFDGFQPELIARWDQERTKKALQNAGIIRSPKKIQACIGNAKIYLERKAQGEDFAQLCWSYVDGKPIVSAFENYRDGPTKTDISERFSKDLKKIGYKFVGPTIVYAWMQACGLYNDHEIGCPRRKEVQALVQ